VFTPLKISNGTPFGRLARYLKATLPINQLKGNPPLEDCPISNVHRCKPTKNSIRTADLNSSGSVTDKEMNPSTKGADSNLHGLYMYIINNAGIHLIVISFFVYILVNLVENLIHYNIGRYSNQETKIELPTRRDFIKIVVVMIVFAALQGVLTYWFNSIRYK